MCSYVIYRETYPKPHTYSQTGKCQTDELKLRTNIADWLSLLQNVFNIISYKQKFKPTTLFKLIPHCIIRPVWSINVFRTEFCRK